MSKIVKIAAAEFADVPYIDVPLADGSGNARFYDCAGVTEITENGTYNVAGLAEAIVTVESGGGDHSAEDGIIDRTITAEYSNSRVTSIGSYAFSFCSKLTSINLPAATSIGSSALYYCSGLTSINFPAATSIGNTAFQYCYRLPSINLPAATSIGSSAFYSCSKLTSINLPAATSIGSSAFYSCSKLTSLILRNTTKVCTYSTTSSSSDPKNANLKIYVPRDLLKSYKTATNWVRLADKFVALEDYTVDGTTTGELDPEKVGA